MRVFRQSVRMYRYSALIFSLFAAPVLAQDIHRSSALVARQGLSAAVTAMAGQSELTPDDRFALGGLLFLRAVERTLQTRWQSNAVMQGIDIPVLRLPVAPNPDAKPFEAGLVSDLFADLRSDLATARKMLTSVPAGAELGVTLDLDDIWFDVNMNGLRDPEEALFSVASGALQARQFGTPDPVPDSLPVRFDTADLPWLIAYTHLLSGIGELVAAYDPTAAIALVMDSNAKMLELRGSPDLANSFDAQFGKFVDIFSMVYLSLNSQPDAAHTQMAHAHFLSMITENRKFWALLEGETDNQAEWIPNGSQTAALGYELPDDAGSAWQDVLSDAEALLKGEKLVPYWRVAPSGGVNVARLFQDPPQVNIVTWAQGVGLLPYLQQGPTVDVTSVAMFQRMLRGDALMFAVLLN